MRSINLSLIFFLVLLSALTVVACNTSIDDLKGPDGGSQLCGRDSDCKNGKQCFSGVCKYSSKDAGCETNEQCDGGFCNFIKGLCIFTDAGKVSDSGIDSEILLDTGHEDSAFDGSNPDSGMQDGSQDSGWPIDSGSGDIGPVDSCSTSCECPQGNFCHQTQHVCMFLSDRPTYCCEKADCPAGHSCTHFSGAIDFCAPSGVPCNDPCDCAQGMTCLAGKCSVGSNPSFCCNNLGCPFDENCKKRGGVSGKCPNQKGWECVRSCDCMRQHLECQENKCVYNEKIPYCCELPNCKKGEECLKADGATISTCMICQKDCDCPQGYPCLGNECIVGFNSPSYCCNKAGCPGGADCTNSAGESFNSCKGSTKPCNSNCECPQGWFCETNQCKEDLTSPVYCCDLPVCPSMEGCWNVDGTSGSCPNVQY